MSTAVPGRLPAQGSGASGSSAKKLPGPNPNRMRPRVSRGCDPCKAKHTKCNGKLPCDNCIKHSRDCKYNAPYTRGKIPPIIAAVPANDGSSSAQRSDESETDGGTPGSALSFHRPSAREEPAKNWQPQYPFIEDSLDSRRRDERENDANARPRKMPRLSTASEPAYDVELDFRGSQARPSDKGLFQRTQSNLNYQNANRQNSIFSYGDPPLPEVDTTFLALPTPVLSLAMVARYFDVTAATPRFLHRKTLEGWMDKLLETSRSMKARAVDHSKNAVVLMVFAMASGCSSNDDEEDPDSSFHYFQAAEGQLKKETGEVHLSTIQARLLQCVFLCSRSRIHQCWSIFGTVVSLIFTMGLQRKDRASDTGDMVEIECQRRAFWMAYTLDKHLSSTLGRPCMIRDEDIDQELPQVVDDNNLSSTSLTMTSSGVQSTMKATVFSIKLAQILSVIIRDLYGAQKVSTSLRLQRAKKHQLELQSWRASATSLLDVNPAVLDFPRAMQYIGLQLAYSQALVLLHRPFVLQDPESDTLGGFDGPLLREQIRENTGDCINAAIDIVNFIDQMYRKDKHRSSSWVTTPPSALLHPRSNLSQFVHYCGYCAVVVLYVFVIKKQAEPLDKRRTCFDAGANCQAQIKFAAEQQGFADRCNRVLEELKAEAVGHMPVNGDGSETRQGSVDTDGSGLPQQGQTSHFGGEWRDMNFDQSAPGGGILGSLFNTVEGINVRTSSGTLMERIDRWGFSSLTN